MLSIGFREIELLEWGIALNNVVENPYRDEGAWSSTYDLWVGRGQKGHDIRHMFSLMYGGNDLFDSKKIPPCYRKRLLRIYDKIIFDIRIILLLYSFVI